MPRGSSTTTFIPYRATTGRTWPRYLPHVIVIVFVFDFADPRGLLSRECHLTASYPLYTSPEALVVRNLATNDPIRTCCQMSL